MDAMNLKEILVKKPFKRVLPYNHYSGTVGRSDALFSVPNADDTLYQIVRQSDFKREYEPSGHTIYNTLAYPDRVRKDPDTGQTFTEPVVRCAFAFQRVILVKQLMHLCGKDIQFEIPSTKDTKRTNELFFKFKEGWATKNMEVAFYEFAKGVKKTGDSAFVGYKYKGKFAWKVLSFDNGDTLYPHYNNITGQLEVFARQYNDLDENGKSITSYVEVWDDRYLYRYKQDQNGVKGAINKVKEVFGLSGYSLIEQREHGFPFIPVAYKRDEMGACWSMSQDSIDQFELAFSQLSQNNMAYAFPIMYMKGDNVELIGDMFGSVKGITMGQDDDAGFLNKPSGSENFKLQLDTLYKMIYELSFCVTPPELKSGDLPGIAIKLLYSPAVEFASKDAIEYNEALSDMVRIFKEGYGTEVGMISEFNTLDIYGWIEPYVPQNITEEVTNMAMAIQNGFLSKQTASEKIPTYAKNSEWERILKEIKEEQQHDLLAQLGEMRSQQTEGGNPNNK